RKTSHRTACSSREKRPARHPPPEGLSTAAPAHASSPAREAPAPSPSSVDRSRAFSLVCSSVSLQWLADRLNDERNLAYWLINVNLIESPSGYPLIETP